MKKLSLTQRIIIGSILGIIVGYFMGPSVIHIKFMGDVFLRLVTMVVPILIFCAIVEAVASLEIKELGKIGTKTLALFLFSTAIAAAVGIIAVTLFKPSMTLEGLSTAQYEGYVLTGSFINLIVNFIPANIVRAFAEGTLIQIMVFGTMFGVAINATKDNPHVAHLYNGIKALRLLMMKIVTAFMVIAPFGIFAMLANVVGGSGAKILMPLVQYILTVTGANIVFIVGYTIVVGAICRLNPIQLVKNVSRTIVIGMATGSSAMSLPTEMMDADERLGLDRKISNFVLPLGNAINTNGAAITTTVASVTCAHLFGIELTTQHLIMIAVYAALSTFGNTTVPGGGIVAVAVVFQMAGLPLEGVALFAGVDYFTSLTRIILNVVGDIYVAILVAVPEKALDRAIFNAPNRITSKPVN